MARDHRRIIQMIHPPELGKTKQQNVRAIILLLGKFRLIAPSPLASHWLGRWTAMPFIRASPVMTLSRPGRSFRLVTRYLAFASNPRKRIVVSAVSDLSRKI